jgi:hypothetical protein
MYGQTGLLKVSWRKAMKVFSVVVLGALALSGCSKDYVTGSQGDVIFRIIGINGGDVLDSDVLTKDGSILADEVNVTVVNRPKNPLTTVPQVAMAVFIERYEVTYIRSDGHNVAGVDVPFGVSGNVSAVVDAASSGNSVEVPIQIVRAAAKAEPPLRNLQGGGGQAIFTVQAVVTLYGRTVAGDVVSDTASCQINFANFGD